MLPSVLSALTTGEWVVSVGSGLLLLLSLVPAVWLCWRFVQMSDEEVVNSSRCRQAIAARESPAIAACSKFVIPCSCPFRPLLLLRVP
jgi:hypothetical protein